MIDRLKTLAVAGAVVAAMSIVLPAGASAQSDTDIDVRAGYTVPLGDMADGWDDGGNIGVAASFWLNDNFAVRLDGAVDLLTGAGVGDETGPEDTFNDVVPDATLFYLSGGVEFSLTDRAESDLSVLVNAGGGYTRFDSDDVSEATVSPSFGENYFHAKGGAQVGYKIADQVDVGLMLQLYATFADEADTQFFPEFRPAEGLEAFSTALTLPISATIRIKF